ncbi:LPS export ABC transporter ATP-binding protein [Aquifex pyrophilus]
MLEVREVFKSFKGRQILKGVSLEVDKGEVVGLLGPNGAGKTTLFNAIIGFVSTDRGSIRIDGEDVTHLPPFRRAKKGLSFLPQEHSLFEDLTVLENLLIFLEFFTKDRNEALAKAETLLEDFGLIELKDQKAYALSGGQKRRLEIARSLITNPRYILLDEPFAGLDPIIVSEIRKLILRLKGNNIGILITDHNVRETIRMVDRVYIISEGRIIAKGYPEDVVKVEAVKKNYLGEDFEL